MNSGTVMQYMKAAMASYKASSIEVELERNRVCENRISVLSLPEDHGFKVGLNVVFVNHLMYLYFTLLYWFLRHVYPVLHSCKFSVPI